MTSTSSDGVDAARKPRHVEANNSGVFAHLIATAQTPTPANHPDPFRSLAALLTASAAVAAQADLAERSRTTPGSSLEPMTRALAQALAGLLRAAAAIAADFDIADLLADAIRSRYLHTLHAPGSQPPCPAQTGAEPGDDEYWVLAATTRTMTARYPAETGVYRRVAKIYEEGGEVAEQIHIHAGSGIKRQKHGPFQPARLADELSDLMRSAVATALDFDIIALLADTLTRLAGAAHQRSDP